MGTDVHAVWQAKKDGKWVDVPSAWDQDRHYFLFSWLAGVRNGYGFAGIPTYTAIKPIAAPRGLPEDFEDGEGHRSPFECHAQHRREWREKENDNTVYMGDHSFSWLHVDEILSAPNPSKIWRTGIVERKWFDAWDGHTPPKNWSGGISGKAIVVAESPTEVQEDSTHVRIFWMQDGDELDYFINEVKRIKEEYGDARVVFGFDS